MEDKSTITGPSPFIDQCSICPHCKKDINAPPSDKSVNFTVSETKQTGAGPEIP